jgi:hypothetical protein
MQNLLSVVQLFSLSRIFTIKKNEEINTGFVTGTAKIP